MGRPGHRRERFEFAAQLRRRGLSTTRIAQALRDRYGINARLAVRTACGWSQDEVAAAWSVRWPEDPKTFKNVSYWENWPGPTGHAPSLAVLDRLAQLYRCDVADLLAGWGEHRPAPASTDADTQAWQLEHLDLDELTRAAADWAQRLSPHRRRALLLKLSTASARAADTVSPDGRVRHPTSR